MHESGGHRSVFFNRQEATVEYQDAVVHGVVRAAETQGSRERQVVTQRKGASGTNQFHCLTGGNLKGFTHR